MGSKTMFAFSYAGTLMVNLLKIQGFWIPHLKIHGLRGTHVTHANAATALEKSELFSASPQGVLGQTGLI